MKPARRAGAIILSALAVFLLACPLVNDWSARQVLSALCRIPLPEDTRLLDQVSRAGKLSGNGNGMQLFGAILIESGLSLEELDEYYSQYRADEWTCIVEKQDGQEIQAVEHGKLCFGEPIGENCYIVYSWGDGPELFSEFDLRGH